MKAVIFGFCFIFINSHPFFEDMSGNSLSQVLHFGFIAIFVALFALSGITYVSQTFGLFSELKTLTILLVSIFELILYGMGRYILPQRQLVVRSMARRKQEDKYFVLGRDLGDDIEQIVTTFTRKFWIEYIVIGIGGAIGIACRTLTSLWIIRVIGLILLVIVILFFYRNLTEDPEKLIAPDTRVSATGQKPIS